MKKYRRTRRSALLFFLLGILTIGIYPLVLLHHVGKEVNQMYEGTEGYKKSMPFVGAFFLGIITLGIVPLVWICRVAGKIGRKGYELEIRKAHIAGGSMFLLGFLFGWLLITAIIAWVKFLHTLNAIERKLNELADAKAKEEAEAEILPEEEPVAEAVEEPEAVEAPAEPEPTAEEPKEEEPKEEAAPAEEEPKPEEPEPEEEPYVPAPRKNVRKWRVRMSNSTDYKVFDTEEEAMAYAKGLAEQKKAKIRFKR